MTLSVPSFDGRVLDSNRQKTLEFSQYGNLRITVPAKSALSQNMCKIRVGGESVIVSFKDLAKTLHVPQKILKSASREGHLKEAIDVALRMFYHPNEQKKLASFAELDTLVGKEVTTPGGTATLTQEVINKIKRIVNTEYRGFLNQAATGKTERTAKLSPDLYIRVKSSKESLTITALFGKYLAKGGGGKIATSSYHLVLGKPDTKQKRVLKTSLEHNEDAKRDLMQEVVISKKLNQKGPQLGIQEPLSLRVITITDSDGLRREAYMHAGRLYDGDLSNNLENLSPRDRLSVGYQMFHSVAACHKREITHGDIKLENYLFDKRGPRVYLADLAGAKDHTTPQTTPQDTFSSWRPPEDTKKGRSLMRELNTARKAHSKDTKKLEEKFREHEKKADVFTLCAAFGLMAVENPEFSTQGLMHNTVEHMKSLHIGRKLQEKGWSPTFTKLIDRGLSADPEVRPSAKELLKAYQEELKKSDPELLKTLAKKG
ncbi:MAG: protein kinase family protein [Verrucomicrobia bacterium]|nr:protein kinase family protein [Verrucomicrobiota bacterium]MBS0636574.1 protein kinase family protein [Verrucomicrobiota bacterium]